MGFNVERHQRRFDGERYQRRFEELAATGVDIHGEARFVLGLGPASVLDAGCGTGRVALELARNGVEVVGADRDHSMLETARKLSGGQIPYVENDLAELSLQRTFDVVLMAGNVLLFTSPGTEAAVVASCARHLGPGGALVAGFQIERRYPLERYDADCHEAGLVLTERFATWERDEFVPGGGYAVSVHRADAA